MLYNLPPWSIEVYSRLMQPFRNISSLLRIRLRDRIRRWRNAHIFALLHNNGNGRPLCEADRRGQPTVSTAWWAQTFSDVSNLRTHRTTRQRRRVGHGSLFQNPTQPKISGPNPTHKSLHPIQPNPSSTLDRHALDTVWHIRLYRKLYTTTVTHHRQVHSQWKLLFSCSTH